MRTVLWGLTGAIVLGAGLGFFLLFGLPKSEWLPKGIEVLQDRTGLKIEIQGEPSVSIWPRPGLKVGGLLASSADGSVSIKADEAVFEISLDTFLQSDRLTGIALTGGSIALGQDALESLTQQKIFDSPWRSVADLSVQDIDLIVDVPDYGPVRLTKIDGSVSFDGGNNPAKLDLAGFFGPAPFAIDATIDTIAKFSQGRAATVNASLELGDAAFSYAGSLTASGHSTPFAKGEIRFRSDDPVSLLKILGIDATILSPAWTTTAVEAEFDANAARMWFRGRSLSTLRGREVSFDLGLEGTAGWQTGRPLELMAVARSGGLFSAHLGGVLLSSGSLNGPLQISVLNLPTVRTWLHADRLLIGDLSDLASLKADLSASELGLALADIKLDLDGEVIEGSFAADFRNSRPVLSAALAADRLILPDWSMLTELGGSQSMQDGLDRIEAATLDLSLGSVRLGTTEAQRTDASITYEQGALAIDLQRLDVFNGTLKGTVRGKADGSGAWEGSLSAAEIDIAGLGLSSDIGLSGGTLGGVLGFKTGQTQTAPYGLEISGQISAFDGTLAVPDLSSEPQDSPANAPFTEFQQLEAQLLPDQDTLRFERLRLKTRTGIITGDGTYRWSDRHLSADLETTAAGGKVMDVLVTGAMGDIDVQRSVRPARPLATLEPPSAPGPSAPDGLSAGLQPETDLTITPSDGSQIPSNDALDSTPDQTAASGPSDTITSLEIPSNPVDEAPIPKARPAPVSDESSQ
ncbi:MAG: hypothetical protein AAGC81_17210 [Pseudomonadota bacterium]